MKLTIIIIVDFILFNILNKYIVMKYDLNNKILEAINRGIKFALDDYDDQEEIQGQVNSKVGHQHGTKEWLNLMNEVVDLRLPSGTLWCKYNLDVNPNQLSNAEDWYGKYYAWGELEGNKTNEDGDIYFGWDNYKFGNAYYELTKYCNNSDNGLNGFTDNLTQLLSKDDVAYQKKKFYNFKFHIPTKEQCEELINYTKNYWVNNYKGIKRLNGRIFEGQNGNQMFIPAAGYRKGSDINDDCSHGYLWSSDLNLDKPSYAYHLYFNLFDNIVDRSIYCLGFTVRPVLNL